MEKERKSLFERFLEKVEEQNTSPDFIVFMANGNYNCTFIYFFCS